MHERFLVKDLIGVSLGATKAKSCSYPASKIQNGLILEVNDRDLSEEGVGFGVPVLKLGSESVFPDSWGTLAEKYDEAFVFKADYRMNLVARMARRDKIIKNNGFTLAREMFSKIHREYPRLRSGMSFLSRKIRRSLGLEDAFFKIQDLGFVEVTYLILGSRIDVTLNFPTLNGCTELIILNEQGATCFNAFKDADGSILSGKEIGSWNESTANYATFIDTAEKLSFTLKR